MKTPGRNDPCPCGSGKKYKKCCFLKENKAPKTYHDHCLDIGQALRDKILQFMKRNRFDQYISLALGQYWQTLEPDLEPPEVNESDYLGIMEWFIHDFPIPGPGKPIIRLYLESDPQLPAEERQILEDWQKAYISVFQIKEVEPGKGVLLEDIFSGDEAFLSDVSMSGQARKWEIITVRKVKVLEEWQASAVGSREDPGVKTEIRDFVRERFRKHRRKYPHLDLPTFLRENGYLLRQRILTLRVRPPEPPPVLTSSGKKMAFWEAHYELHDLAQALRLLDREEDYDKIEWEEDRRRRPLKVVFDWLDRGPSAKMVSKIDRKKGVQLKSFFFKGPGEEAYRVLGSVTLEPGGLLLAAQGERRLAVGKERLEKVLAGLLRHKLDSVRSLDSMLKAQGHDKPAKSAEEMPIEVKRALIKETFDPYYRQWLDTPIPTLKGNTPRQAAQNLEDRHSLEDVLREMEFRHQKGDMSYYDVSWIRRELGM